MIQKILLGDNLVTLLDDASGRLCHKPFAPVQIVGIVANQNEERVGDWAIG